MKDLKDRKVLKGFFIGMAAALIVVAVIFALYLYLPFGYSASTPDGLAAQKKISQAMSAIRNYYSGDVDEQTLTDYMFLGLVSGLGDKYSTYYTKEEYEEIQTTREGHYKGIGVTFAISTKDGSAEILSVTEDGPADKAGIVVDDVIKSINGTSVEGMTSSEIVTMIQEAESDDIVLEIYRPSSEEEFEAVVTRDVLDTISVRYSLLDDDIGYISISTFNALTAEQFKAALDALTPDAEALVIDLRDNQGGLVSASRDILKELIPDGVLFYTEDKNGKRTEITSDSGNEVDLPIAVLVNEKTASASEIMAGALQDRGKAVIVGTQTYGKGIIQDVFKLGDGSVIRLTIEHYYTPNGNDIHEVGITPDVEAGYDEDAGTDMQYEAALEALGMD